MATVIHFNTFFDEEGEENKMNILDALESMPDGCRGRARLEVLAVLARHRHGIDV